MTLRAMQAPRGDGRPGADSGPPGKASPTWIGVALAGWIAFVVILAAFAVNLSREPVSGTNPRLLSIAGVHGRGSVNFTIGDLNGEYLALQVVVRTTPGCSNPYVGVNFTPVRCAFNLTRGPSPSIAVASSAVPAPPSFFLAAPGYYTLTVTVEDGGGSPSSLSPEFNASATYWVTFEG